MLGLRDVAANGLVPPQLLPLAGAVPAGHPWLDSPQVIVMQHTLVPLYLHFAHPKRAASLTANIVAGATGNPAASLGLTVTAVRPLTSSQKFCAECVDHDQRERGFPVGYREHQPSFVKVCVRHAKPLFFGCSNCQGQRKALSMWKMAGRCECSSPMLEPATRVSGDSVYDAGALYLATQVETMLARPFQAVPLAHRLREALTATGFAGRTGLDHDKIKSALARRFGDSLLQDLGIADRHRSGSGWPSRMLGPAVLEGEKTPNALRCMLLAGLVVDNVADLHAAKPQAQPPAPAIASGYSTPTALKRDVLAEDAIASALRACKGRIVAAASHLGVSPARLAVDMRLQSMTLPLPPATAKRLGPKVIAGVTQALRCGVPKGAIQRTYAISEWTLQLIELADPELRDLHRQATIIRQREAHRHRILANMQLHPSHGRSEIMATSAAAFDWLRKFDREWLESNLPRPKSAVGSQRNRRANWQGIDEDGVTLIREEVQRELSKQGRPRRISVSRLLRAAGALNKEPALLPLTVAAAKSCAESDEAYLRRRVTWAVHAYIERRVPLSMNQLRRLAALPPTRLLTHRELIQTLAQGLHLTIDARSTLSPHKD